MDRPPPGLGGKGRTDPQRRGCGDLNQQVPGSAAGEGRRGSHPLPDPPHREGPLGEPQAEPCAAASAQTFVPWRNAPRTVRAGSLGRGRTLARWQTTPLDLAWAAAGSRLAAPRPGVRESLGLSLTPPPAGSGNQPGKHFPVEDGMQPAFLCLSQLLVFCYSLRSSDKQFLLPCDHC